MTHYVQIDDEAKCKKSFRFSTIISCYAVAPALC